MSESVDQRSVSVVICVLNEEAKLPRAVASVRWADEILILDSGSTDATVAVGRALGARVESCHWRGFSAQKNEAARRATHDWILSLDADEIVDDELGLAIRSVLAAGPDPRDGYSVSRRGDFLGALLPDANNARRRRDFVRLYHRRRSTWDESMSVHERVVVPGRRMPLSGTLLHINDLTVDQYIALFNRYASAEADVLHRTGQRCRPLDLTIRPLARFVWHAAVKREALLGRRGLAHAGIKAASDLIRYVKVLEAELGERATFDRPAAQTPTVPVGGAHGEAGGGLA